MDQQYDVVVIGGGVTGCATLFELTQSGYRCLLVEKNHALLSEASSGNSGMLHTGFDVLEDSIELDCVRHTQTRIFDLADKLGVPVNKIGATMVAWNEHQLMSLPEVLSKSQRCGCTSVRQLSASELHQREPHLHGNALSALWIPDEAVTDPWLLPLLLAHTARTNGAQIVTSTLVQSVERSTLGWNIITTCGHACAKCVVNCAGLYGDIVDRLAGKSQFKIKPRKGQYTVYDKTAKPLLNSSMVPVPTDIGKGVIVFRSVYDNVVIGPTAEDVESRQRAAVEDSIIQRLADVADNTVPLLGCHNIVGYYTGVRPATEVKDYIIKADTEKYWITVGGIRSTGLSGCLGISEKVCDFVKSVLKIEPSRGVSHSVSKPEVRFTSYGCAMIDGLEYRITHPLTYIGRENSWSKM